MNARIAFAIASHPDDIEFRIAGTMLLLKQAGYELHYMNIANGSCGTVQYNQADTIRIRRGEAKRAAAMLGAHWHPSLVNDIEVFYDLKTLKRLTVYLQEPRTGRSSDSRRARLMSEPRHLPKVVTSPKLRDN